MLRQQKDSEIDKYQRLIKRYEVEKLELVRELMKYQEEIKS